MNKVANADPSENLGLILQSMVCFYNIMRINTAAKGISSFIAMP